MQERSGAACDHYRRFPQDFDLAARLGHTAHRFSIEWARIEPEDGVWDDAALAHYVQVVAALRERRIEPLVTLHHFTSPHWFTAQGGWTRPDAVDRFARYTERVAKALGSAVRYWFTINEPMVYVRMHHLQGTGPPGGRDLGLALRATEHLIRAHAAAYRVLHAANPGAQVSIAHNTPAFAPHHRWWPPDRWVAGATDQIFSFAFIEALLTGVWKAPIVGTWRLPEARGTLDYLGMNFYGRKFLRCWPWPGKWPGIECNLVHHRREVPERSDFGWDVAPDPFGAMLVRLSRFKVPIIVSENGVYVHDDARRVRFIEGHVQAMARAMQQGARVIGYCYWSLLDNFEWADGYGPRFGIIEVDYATQARRIRDSGQRYAAICRANAIELP